MSEALSSVDKFRIDGAWHLAREVREHVRKILSHMESRGDDGERVRVEELLQALQSSLESVPRGKQNHGGIDGDSSSVWRTIALGALSLNAGLLVWGLATLVQLKEDVAVLRCQVNPAFCLKVASGPK